MVFPVPDNYSREDFIRICEQIAKMGERDHEHLKVVRNAANNQWELRAVAKPRGCARIWSWFYKPAECRFANVSAFAITFFNRYQKEYQDTCPIASIAIQYLKNRWSHKSCSGELDTIYERINHQAVPVLFEQAKAAAQQAEESRRKSETMLKETQQQTEQMIREQSQKAEELFKQSQRKAKIAREDGAAEIYYQAMQTLTQPIPTDAEMAMRKKLNDKATMDCRIKCKNGEVVKAHWDQLQEIDHFRLSEGDRKGKVALEPVKNFDLGVTEIDSKSHAADAAEGGFSAETVSSMIHFLYLGKVDVSEMSAWLELVRLAHFVKFERLKEHCYIQFTEYLKKNPTALFDVIPQIPNHHPATRFFTEKFLEIDRYRIWFDVSHHRQDLLFQTFKERSERDESDLPAFTALGRCYQKGVGTETDMKLAEATYKHAVDQNYAPAQGALAYIIRKQPGQEDRVYSLRKASAAQGWWAAGITGFADCYLKGVGIPKNDVEAVRHLTKAAEMGDAIAQECLAYLLLKGNEGLQRDVQKALEWREKAVAQGVPEAQYNLGLFYQKGVGVQHNPYKAFVYCSLAAQQGYDEAINLLGLMYKNGIGVSQEPVKAFQHFRAAANKKPKSGQAQYNLAGCYERGEGVEAHRDEAIRWYREAAVLGVARAVQALQRLGVPIAA